MIGAIQSNIRNLLNNCLSLTDLASDNKTELFINRLNTLQKLIMQITQNIITLNDENSINMQHTSLLQINNEIEYYMSIQHSYICSLKQTQQPKNLPITIDGGTTINGTWYPNRSNH